MAEEWRLNYNAESPQRNEVHLTRINTRQQNSIPGQPDRDCQLLLFCNTLFKRSTQENLREPATHSITPSEISNIAGLTFS